MPSLTVLSQTSTSIKLYVTGLDSPANTWSAINIYNATSGSLLASVNSGGGGSTGNYYSTSYDHTGLTAGSTYQYELRYKKLVGDTATSIFYSFTTDYVAPSDVSISTPITVSVKDIAVDVNTGNMGGKQGLGVEVERSWGGSASASAVANSYATVFMTAPSYSTTYSVRARAFNQQYQGAWTGWTSFTTGSAPIPAIPTISYNTRNGKSITINWSTGANTQDLEFEYSWTSTTEISNSALSNNSGTFTFTAPAYNTTYQVRARGKNSDATGSWSNWLSVTTGADSVAPTVTSLVVTGNNIIEATWSATDDSSLRTTSTYALAINSGGATALVHRTYIDLGTNTYQFANDGSGNAFQTGISYKVGLTVYDSSNNASTQSIQSATIVKTKPTDFVWSTTKSVGTQYKLTVTEWQGLIDKINAWKSYFGQAIITTFNTTVTSGAINTDCVPSALSAQQVINGINSMSPPTAPPAVPSTGQIITATFLNSLVSSLNSLKNKP